MAKITLDEKARTLLAHITQSKTPQDSIEAIKLALKEQDRDTRHACAEAIVTTDFGEAHVVADCDLRIDRYHHIVMNCRGGVE